MLGDGVARPSVIVNPYPTYPAENRSGGSDPNVFDSVPTLVLLPGATYGQLGPPIPLDNVDSVEFRANGYMAIDFHEFITGSEAAPGFLDEVHAATNGLSITVSPQALVGFAAGQGLLLITSMVTALTTPPDASWMAAGQLVQAGTFMDAYVFWKIAEANEPDVQLIHTGQGRIGATLTNWSNPHPTLFVENDATFKLPTDLTGFTSPAVTPPHDNSVVVSFVTDGGAPIYNAPPPTFTLIAQYIMSAVAWLGVAYKTQTAAVATGNIVWNCTNQGGSKVCGTVILRGSGQTIERRPVDIMMRYNHPSGPGEDGFGHTDWPMHVIPKAP